MEEREQAVGDMQLLTHEISRIVGADITELVRERERDLGKRERERVTE